MIDAAAAAPSSRLSVTMVVALLAAMALLAIAVVWVMLSARRSR